MKARNSLIALCITVVCTFLMSPVKAFSDPTVLGPGFVRVEMFADGFAGPTGLAFDNEGNLYVTNERWIDGDPNTWTVSKVTPDGDVTIFSEDFIGPSGIAYNTSEENLYVSDQVLSDPEHGVWRMTPHGLVKIVETQGITNAIAFDDAYNLYPVVCHEGPAIYKVTPEGDVEVFVDNPASDPIFHCPQAAVFDDSGNLYTSDFTDKVFQISPAGEVSVYANYPGGGTEGGLVFDKDGNLYVSGSPVTLTVYRIPPGGGQNVAEPFVTGFTPGDHTYYFPRGMVFDTNGNLYIAEHGTGIVWRVVSVAQGIDNLIASVRSLELPKKAEKDCIKQLESAKSDYNKKKYDGAFASLNAFIAVVEAQREEGNIQDSDADMLIGEAEDIISAIPFVPDIWSTKAPMPTARTHATSSAVGSKIYVIGGNAEGTVLDVVEEYHTATDSWATKTPMPTPRHQFGSTAMDGKIYAIGGHGVPVWGGYGYHLDTVEVYDPATDSWTAKASMPTPRSNATISAASGKVYAIGGRIDDYPWGPRTDSDINEEYDPATDTWTTRTPMPSPRVGATSSVLDGKIYVIGGINCAVLCDPPSSKVEVYDPATDTWTTKTPMPTGRYDSDSWSGVVNGKIYVIVGDVNYEYDPVTDTWTTRTPMPTSLGATATAGVKGKIYVIVGDVNYEYDPNPK